MKLASDRALFVLESGEDCTCSICEWSTNEKHHRIMPRRHVMLVAHL